MADRLVNRLYDDPANVTEGHRAVAARITDEERLAVLQIKDVWHRRPECPGEVSGFEIYTAVLDHNVRTPDSFARWLRTTPVTRRSWSCGGR